MKTSELMIGDWIQVSNQLNSIKQIRSTFDMDSAVLYQPIPLTSEILEKNGWVFNNAETWVGGGLLLQSVDNCAYRIVVNSDYNYEATNDTPFIILYVHELQHALRLRRIRKEIIL